MKSFKIFCLMAVVALMQSCTSDSPGNDLKKDSDLSNSVKLETSLEEIESNLDATVFYANHFFDLSTIFGKRPDDPSGFFRDCLNVVSESTEDTHTITITFEEGCEDKEGNSLSGTISISKSKTEENRERIITFTNFTFNGYVVNGTKSFTYTKENANGNPELRGTVSLVMETEDGTVKKEGNRTIEMTAGGDTMTHEDDELTISGSSNYTKEDGSVIAIVITVPLIKPAGCKYIASGTKTYTENEETATLDFGDGSCDNIAVLTEADGTVTEIRLKRKRS